MFYEFVTGNLRIAIAAFSSTVLRPPDIQPLLLSVVAAPGARQGASVTCSAPAEAGRDADHVSIQRRDRCPTGASP